MITNQIIYFDERLHKYTDSRGNIYTSVTTVIPKYHEEFKTDDVAAACERIGRNPAHPKYLKYKGKTAAEIKYGWNKIKVDALANGNKKHDYLEDTVKKATNYRTIEGTDLIQDRLFTIEDIANNTFGELSIEWFITSGIAFRYPKIYSAILTLHNAGFKFYAEVGVYNVELLVSGKIDLIAVKGLDFIIIDWKTNKDDIRYEAGYFDKDMNGKSTNIFISTNKYMRYPLHFLPDSIGNHYNLQVSGYAWLLEQFGFKNIGNIIYQIRETEEGLVEKVDKISLFDYREKSASMFKHHFENRILKPQLKINYAN
ncbi:MAG: hypothetical protein M0R17_08005 [Candidatus Omnitrophica bacterium]|jgi:hypothetical protein|nr:hypothetical protein [Candidatus Omnitrophota bacterium]